jgi:hypothetical protein
MQIGFPDITILSEPAQPTKYSVEGDEGRVLLGWIMAFINAACCSDAVTTAPENADESIR